MKQGEGSGGGGNEGSEHLTVEDITNSQKGVGGGD